MRPPPASPPAPEPAARPGWQPAAALRRAVLIAGLTLLAAAVLGRRELVLVAVPFAIGTALSLAGRPRSLPRLTFTLDPPVAVEGGPVAARVEVTNDNRAPLLCVVHTRVPRWVRLAYGVGFYAAQLPPERTTLVLLRGVAYRWGAYRFGPAVARTIAADGLLYADAEVMPALPLPVFPATDVFEADQALPRAAGIVGQHRSRRPGESGELADVRAFRTGDRLRRINWRVTQRTGELHVNATYAERDAEVLLLLDVRHEAGRSGGVGGAASVLDATVRAAGAIAGHYTHQGDRVALVEFGTRLRRLRSGTGRRHYQSALSWLSDVDPMPAGSAPSGRLLSASLRPPTALVIMLTPLLDLESASLLAMLVRAGRSVVAVDTLPSELRPPDTGEWTSAATRLWHLERVNLLGRLREVGVPVEPWQGAGSLDQLLRHVTRLAASTRMAHR